MSADATAANDVPVTRRRQALAAAIVQACSDILADQWEDEEPTQLSGWATLARVSTVERDRAIRQALADGHSLRTVADWAGLTHPAVAKIRDRG